MSTSTLIVDYLGVGLAAAIPVAPNVPSTGSAFYYETDTPALRVWDGSAWQVVATGVAAGTVTHTAGALTAHGPIVGAGAGDEKALAAMTDGQLMIGHTGADPDLATLTAGTGITITNAAGSVTIAAVNLGTVTHTAGALTAHAPVLGAGGADTKTTAALTNGQLLIGATGVDPIPGTLTAGTGITIANGSGAIVISINSTGVIHTSGDLTANAIVVGGGTNDIEVIGPLTDGQLIIGNTGNPATLTTLTAGTGISITNGAGSITIASTVTGTVTHTAGALTAHAPIVGAGSADEKALAAMTDGQLMIGSTGVDPALATLTAGTGITITNAAGSITIAASGGGTGTVTSVATGTGLTGGPITGAGTISFDPIADKRILGNISGASAAPTAITIGGYIDYVTGSVAGSVPYRGTTGWAATAAMTDGQLLIGTTGGNPALATITAGTGITVTNSAGGITIDCTVTSGTGTVTHTGGNLTNHAPMVGAGTADSKTLAAMTDGQLMIGTTGADPDLATLTAGNGITITNAAGSITLAATGTGKQYNVAFSHPSTSILTASEVCGHHRVAVGITFPANFGAINGHASQAGGSAVTTASTVISVEKAASASPNTFSQIGTITFALGTVTPTFATASGAAQTLAQGDVLRIIGPASADATFAGLYVTLCASET